MPNVTFDISEETFAKIRNISETSEISESLAVEFLINSALPDEPLEESQYSIDLRDSVVEILRVGITIDTLKSFGIAYEKWFNESCDVKTSSEIFQEAFDIDCPK